MEKLLLHFCCAICGIGIFEELSAQGRPVTAFWFNPNIYPLEEYEKRRDAVKRLSEKLGLPVVYNNEYSQKEWLNAVKGFAQDAERRHLFCYRLRLEKTAKYAQENGFTYFTTTLLSSPHQKHQEIKQMGEEIAKSKGINFFYEDFRPWHYGGKKEAKNLNLYSQKYCGCLYSKNADVRR